MSEHYSNKSQKLEKLLEILGKPKNGTNTDCSLRGVIGPKIYKKEKDTGYHVVGAIIKFIVNEKGETVARLGGRCGREIVDLHCRPTGYWLTGSCGMTIGYETFDNDKR